MEQYFLLQHSKSEGVSERLFSVSSEMIKCVCEKVFLTPGGECNDGIVL